MAIVNLRLTAVISNSDTVADRYPIAVILNFRILDASEKFSALTKNAARIMLELGLLTASIIRLKLLTTRSRSEAVRVDRLHCQGDDPVLHQ